MLAVFILCYQSAAPFDYLAVRRPRVTLWPLLKCLLNEAALRQKNPDRCMILRERSMLQVLVVTKPTAQRRLGQYEICYGALKTHKAISCQIPPPQCKTHPLTAASFNRLYRQCSA